MAFRVDGKEESKEEKPDLPRTFLGKAYLKVLEKGVYGLFRDLCIEEPRPGKEPVVEKVKAVGPIKVLREARPGEEAAVVLRTVHPSEGRDIALIELKP